MNPPRDISSFVSRRAWIDPRVRFWWIAGGVLLWIAAWLAVSEYLAWSRLNRAINHGLVVQATIDAIDGDTRQGRLVTPSSTIGLTFQHGGRSHTVVGSLGDRPGKPQARVGGTVPLHIDPADPQTWTAQDAVPALSYRLIGPALVLPIALLCLLIAWLSRRSLLRTYAVGAAHEAIVAENKQTPLAPRSRAIKCSLTPDSRLMEVFVPASHAGLSPRDKVRVILPSKSGRPIAAAWFEEV